MSRVPDRISTPDDMARKLMEQAERAREQRVHAALRQRAGFPRWHKVGDPGEPPFGTGWSNALTATDRPLAFMRDAVDAVRIRGSIAAPSGTPATVIFELPEGFRPHRVERHLVPAHNTTAGDGAYVVVIEPEGDVSMLTWGAPTVSATWESVWIYGLTFSVVPDPPPAEP